MYLSSKFSIFEPCFSIQSPRNLSWESEITQNKFLDNSNTQKSSCKTSRFASFFHKNGYVFIDQIWHIGDFYQCSVTQKNCFTFKNRLQNRSKFQCFSCFRGTRDFVFVDETLYFRALYQKVTPIPKILSINQPNLPFWSLVQKFNHLENLIWSLLFRNKVFFQSFKTCLTFPENNFALVKKIR